MVKQIPNILTVGRLVLTVVFLGMIMYSGKVADDNLTLFLDVGFVIFIIAGLTDIVDGEIARRLNVTSKFGRMLDPFADKVLVCGAFICFAVIEKPILFPEIIGPTGQKIIQWLMAGVITAREVYVTILRHIAEAKGINFSAVAAGKIKMFLQSFAIGTVMVKMAHVQGKLWGYWFTSIIFAITVIVTVLSAYSAIKRCRVGGG